MKKLIVLIGLLVAFSVSAKTCDESVLSAVEWRECVGNQNANAVKISYDNLINALDGNQNAIDAIKQAQLDWEKFMGSTCYYMSETDSRESQAVCYDDFNKARVKILNQYAKQARGK
jgi:hypothetical protein